MVTTQTLVEETRDKILKRKRRKKGGMFAMATSFMPKLSTMQRFGKGFRQSENSPGEGGVIVAAKK